MPYRHAEADDPMVLVGVELDASSSATVDMAYAFAEELVRMGYDERRLLAVFRNPVYRAPHGAYCQLGAEAIERIVAECLEVFGRFRRVVVEPDTLIPLRKARAEQGGAG